MIVNVWLALRDDAQALVRERLAWDSEELYEGPVSDRVFRLFKRMVHLEQTQRLFRIDTPVSRDWTIWSLYFDFPKDALLKIQNEIDNLIATYLSRVRIVGAWHCDGRQVGTQFDEDGVVVGTPTYPIHNRTLEFMPDVFVDAVLVPATELTDVNKLQGQEDRRFG